ncbi:Restriction endonuclease [Anoxybacillus gonensis]|uniref:HNH endonuclease n=1 Tax=Anoxybacillus gonensis TaxID=198467 RepID=A0AAW7TEX0_9BACL|nr:MULTISPECIES: restriction endonuclease [Anoxybacillus]AXM88346.1 restriction endonuclease [Anoxybacillus ayderensis G10]THD16853.1 restriction endonuclease [Anoxybacillus ayderensis]AKS37535.1 Restriction endonuclease [Anoxybacillus gonensis]EMI10245.1 Restriction endonuclease [Anoxybacillus gonensis]KGP61464.1 Restriction endonuclease [Anoxybacillus gonensis]
MKGMCELCERDDVVLTAHHLTPKEYGGTETAKLCLPCHKQIHALYTNEELASRLYTIERLQHDENIAAFIRWIRKQPADRLPKIKKANRKKR